MDTDQAGIKLNWNKVPFPQDEWRYMHVAFSQTRKSWARKPFPQDEYSAPSQDEMEMRIKSKHVAMKGTENKGDVA